MSLPNVAILKLTNYFGKRWSVLLVVGWLQWVSFSVDLTVIGAARSDDDDHTADTSQWNWRPDVPHPCNMERLTIAELKERFGGDVGVPALYPLPLVIVGEKPRNHPFRQLVAKDSIQQQFTDSFNVTLSSSNSFSEHRRTLPLQQYLEELQIPTSPHKLSNESWYLFGETYSSEWQSLLKSYDMPPCQVCLSEYVALSFGIGNQGSGVQWHIHGPGFSESLHGRKHWILYPPHYAPPHFHHDFSTWHWMEYVYSNATLLEEEYYNRQHNGRNVSQVFANGRPYECTLEPGEMIYFPDRWYHATINCNIYTAFISTFTSDHHFLQDLKEADKTNPKATFLNHNKQDEL